MQGNPGTQVEPDSRIRFYPAYAPYPSGPLTPGPPQDSAGRPRNNRLGESNYNRTQDDTDRELALAMGGVNLDPQGVHRDSRTRARMENPWLEQPYVGPARQPSTQHTSRGQYYPHPAAAYAPSYPIPAFQADPSSQHRAPASQAARRDYYYQPRVVQQQMAAYSSMPTLPPGPDSSLYFAPSPAPYLYTTDRPPQPRPLAPADDPYHSYPPLAAPQVMSSSQQNVTPSPPHAALRGRTPNHFCNCLAMKGKLRKSKGKLRKSKEWMPKGKQLVPIGTIQGLKQWHMESKLGPFYQLTSSPTHPHTQPGLADEREEDEWEQVEWRITLLDTDGTPNSFIIRSLQNVLDLSYLRASQERKRRDYFDKDQVPWAVYLEDVKHVFCTCAYLESHLGVYFVSADAQDYQPLFKTHLMRSTQRVPIALAVRLMPFCRAAMRALHPEGLIGEDREQPFLGPTAPAAAKEPPLHDGEHVANRVERKEPAFYPVDQIPPGGFLEAREQEEDDDATFPYGAYQTREVRGGSLLHAGTLICPRQAASSFWRFTKPILQGRSTSHRKKKKKKTAGPAGPPTREICRPEGHVNFLLTLEIGGLREKNNKKMFSRGSLIHFSLTLPSFRREARQHPEPLYLPSVVTSYGPPSLSWPTLTLNCDLISNGLRWHSFSHHFLGNFRPFLRGKKGNFNQKVREDFKGTNVITVMLWLQPFEDWAEETFGEGWQRHEYWDFGEETKMSIEIKKRTKYSQHYFRLGDAPVLTILDPSASVDEEKGEAEQATPSKKKPPKFRCLGSIIVLGEVCRRGGDSGDRVRGQFSLLFLWFVPRGMVVGDSLLRLGRV
eukprot:g74031.t1